MSAQAICKRRSQHCVARHRHRRRARRPPSLGRATRPGWSLGTLCQRELVRFFRQRNRVIGAIGQPLMFWLLFGAGLGRRFACPATGRRRSITYREYFFPGTLVLILLFTAIFATISIIEDRREGFLQSVLVAPIPRWSMVLGQDARRHVDRRWCKGLLFLLLGLTLGIAVRRRWRCWRSWRCCSCVALALTALGFVIAWRMDSTQGFHAIMSVFLMPMWLLSGAFFPRPSGMPFGWASGCWPS